jgi:hypothetical protein
LRATEGSRPPHREAGIGAQEPAPGFRRRDPSVGASIPAYDKARRLPQEINARGMPEIGRRARREDRAGREQPARPARGDAWHRGRSVIIIGDKGCAPFSAQPIATPLLYEPAMRKLLILPLLFVAACDGGGNGGPTGSAELTAAEAGQLTRAIFGMAASLTSGGIPGLAGLDVAPRDQNSFTAPIHRTVPCSPSGSTDIDGTVTLQLDDVTQEATMEAAVSAAPRACAHRLGNGDVIRISGDPDLDIQLAVAGVLAERVTSMQVTETGAFTWTRGGASGRCSVNLASSLNEPTQMVTVTGTFCGFPVSETFPLAEG